MNKNDIPQSWDSPGNKWSWPQVSCTRDIDPFAQYGRLPHEHDADTF